MTKKDIQKYFGAEKSESLIFFGIGIIAIAIGGYFIFVSNQQVFIGASIPLLVIGLIQFIVGSTIFLRSDKDIYRVNAYLQIKSQKLAEEELPRMQKVNKQFDILRWVEIFFALIGICLLILNKSDNERFLYGFAITLTIQSIFMLFADYFAEMRADKYTAILLEHVKKGHSKKEKQS